MSTYVMAQIRAVMWNGNYRKPESCKTVLADKYDQAKPGSIKTNSVAAAWGCYEQTDFVTTDGWRLFKIRPGGRNRHFSWVNTETFRAWWEKRWVSMLCDRLLVREKDYQRLLKKASQEAKAP